MSSPPDLESMIKYQGDSVQTELSYYAQLKAYELEKAEKDAGTWHGSSLEATKFSKAGPSGYDSCVTVLNVGQPEGDFNLYIINVSKSSFTGISTKVTKARGYYEDYWTERISIKDDPKTVRVDNQHYRIGDPVYGTQNRSSLGYGGHVWYIKFHDGREVKTNNLWSQGTIPPQVRDQLPDNAVFVKDKSPFSLTKDLVI